MSPHVCVAVASEPAASRTFTALELDAIPELLEASYRLRYQVYCHERRFLPADYYPYGIETDVFDQHAVHLGVLDGDGCLVGTVRLVRRTEDGLPMFGHCSIVAPHPALADPLTPVIEVSRLCVSRQYSRRKGDAHYGLEASRDAAGARQREGGEIVLSIYRALYQASKRHGFSHWLVATERSLQRLLTRYRFPFRQVGPETDYYGMVAPYLMDLTEFDTEILSGQTPVLRDFLVGLEPHLHPGLRHVS